jgi:hypothetical protein
MTSGGKSTIAVVDLDPRILETMQNLLEFGTTPARLAWNTVSTCGGRNGNSAENALDTAHATAADARAAQLELDANIVHTYIGMSRDYALLDCGGCAN